MPWRCQIPNFTPHVADAHQDSELPFNKNTMSVFETGISFTVCPRSLVHSHTMRCYIQLDETFWISIKLINDVFYHFALRRRKNETSKMSPNKCGRWSTNFNCLVIIELTANPRGLKICFFNPLFIVGVPLTNPFSDAFRCYATKDNTVTNVFLLLTKFYYYNISLNIVYYTLLYCDRCYLNKIMTNRYIFFL